MAGTSPARKRTSKGSPVTAPVVGEPVGRWAKVLAEGQEIPGFAIEPFEVTDDLVLQPLTPRRASKLGAAQNAYLVALAAMANAQRFGATKEETEQIQASIDASITAYNEALFGEDEYPRVVEYFADQPAWKQELFVTAVKQQFQRLPDDGGCKTCGHIEGAAEERIKELSAALAELDKDHPALGEPVGKDSGSSTTSSTTGTSSSQTSPPTSAG